MRALPGFHAIAGEYDGFILDLWGVIHDGVRPYPGAVDCMASLRAAGKRVLLLSNAPRRADSIQRQLRRMGIDDAWYDGVMTSGEAAYLMLRDRPDPWYAALGTRVFHLGPERDRGVMAGLDLQVFDGPAGAEFMLNTGPDDHAPQTDPSHYDPVLQASAAAGLPMICANPDLEVIRGGVRVVCAGTLAVRYAAMGGDVRSLGKPDPAIYRPVLDMLAVPGARVLAVGDALRTDIAGAAAVGLDACWVLGGLHGAHLGGDDARTEAEAAAAGLSPVACIQHFVW
jgi:HAD superfamily hydrolase (TIGR01459 family)